MDSRISSPSRGPSPVREWLLIAAMLTVAWLPLIGAGLVLLVVGVMSGIRQAALSPLLGVLMGSSRAVFGREPLPGRAVQPGAEPELAALVEDVAGRLGFTAPLLVRIVPSPEAALGRTRATGGRSHVLLLGMPLLRTLTAAQLASVIGHELAHDRHLRDRRASWLVDVRATLALRLKGRFRPLAPLAAALLRASQPYVWRAESAADAVAVRLTGSETTRQALETVALLEAAFDGLGEKWLTVLAMDDTCPEDFYDALDTALRDPLVRRRSARAAAEHDLLDPYHTADHPPLAHRTAALPPQADGCAVYGSVPLTLSDAAPIARWCTRRLAGHDSPDRYDPPRPVRILGLGAERLHAPLAGRGPEALITATGGRTAPQAVSAALDAIADGSWPHLARRIDPRLRRLPPPERRSAAREVLAGATGAALAPVLRAAGWSYASRWMSTVFTAPDGSQVDLYDLLTTAVDSGDPATVRTVLEASDTQEVPL